MTEVKIRTWMYISEVATRLRRSERTIRRYINEGSIKAGKPKKGDRNGLLVYGPSVEAFEKRMMENVLEDSVEVENEIEEVVEKKKSKRKVYSKGFVKNW